MGGDQTDLSDATAAPINIKIGDEEFEASPLPLSDWGALQELIRVGIRAAGVRAAESATTDEMRDAVLERYEKKADEFNLLEIDTESSDPQIRERSIRQERIINTPETLARIVWLSLRHKRHDIRYDFVKANASLLRGFVDRIIDRSKPKGGENKGADPST